MNPHTGDAAGPVLTVDAAAITANVAALHAHTGVDVMAVVKADGFGHGATTTARAALAGGATWLGVTSVAEALALRADGIDAPILSWLNPVGADLAPALAAGIDLAVPSLPHLDAVVRAALSATTERPARVHLYLDCGPARDGAAWSDWPALCAAASRAQRAGLLHVIGVMGHLSCADDPQHEANRWGRQRFARGVVVARAAGLTPRHRHLAATAAALAEPRARHTMVRIGAGLYGIDYGLGATAGRPVLRGAATLTAPVVAVRDVATGTPVGYGGTWTAPAATRLALLPLGYADGVPRAASASGEVLLHGRRCRVAGRVSMDQTVVDVGDLPVGPGDVATVFGPTGGPAPDLRDWARWAGTIEHEIVTGLGPRIARATASTTASQAATTTATPLTTPVPPRRAARLVPTIGAPGVTHRSA
ncbi:MAG: alanine racemase [Kineosporiaceae bacterium]